MKIKTSELAGTTLDLAVAKYVQECGETRLQAQPQEKTMSTYDLTPEDKEVLRGLRKAGCAVCVFLPDEMPHSDPDDVEDAMCQGGWAKINFDTPDGEPISA